MLTYFTFKSICIDMVYCILKHLDRKSRIALYDTERFMRNLVTKDLLQREKSLYNTACVYLTLEDPLSGMQKFIEWNDMEYFKCFYHLSICLVRSQRGNLVFCTAISRAILLDRIDMFEYLVTQSIEYHKLKQEIIVQDDGVMYVKHAKTQDVRPCNFDTAKWIDSALEALSFKVLEFMIKMDSNIIYEPKHRKNIQTYLEKAIFTGNIPAVEFLIKKGADIGGYLAIFKYFPYGDSMTKWLIHHVSVEELNIELSTLAEHDWLRSVREQIQQEIQSRSK